MFGIDEYNRYVELQEEADAAFMAGEVEKLEALQVKVNMAFQAYEIAAGYKIADNWD